MEVGFVFRELRDAWPGAFGRRSHQPEDLLELVFVGGAGEEWAARVHLRHDAPRGPDVDAGVVGATAEQDIGGTVPKGDHLVGKGVDWNTKGTREPEISELKLALVVDEQILRFQVAVQYSVFMAEGDPLQKLVHERLDGDVVQLTATAAGIHVFLQILVHVFEDQHEFVFRVDDIV